MIPWIQVYSNLLTHPKTGKLVDALALSHKNVEPECIAAGLLISFWTWAVQNAVSGDLTGMSNRSIAKAAGWTGNADKFADAMRNAGFIDNDRIHDWEEYAALLIDSDEERKAKTRERVRKHRRKKTAENAECSVTDVTSNVTSVTSNASTLHNTTLHNNIDNNSLFLSSENSLEKGEIVENSVENSNCPSEGVSAEEHERLAAILEHAGLKDGAAYHREEAARIRRERR